jgi:hypothetical protein
MRVSIITIQLAAVIMVTSATIAAIYGDLTIYAGIAYSISRGL